MASTSADPELPQSEREAREAREARDSRISERTDALCLKQMLGMGRQSYILLPSVFLIAWLAVREGAAVWAALWFAAWLARMAYVHRLVGHLRRHPDTPPAQALSAVVKGYVFAGIVAGGLLPVFFTRSSDLVLLIVTFLVTVYGSTMMIASSGVLRAGLGYGLPTLGVLIAGWAWRGGALGFGLAGFLALAFALSIGAIRAQRRTLAEVVRVIDDNERLSAALSHERDRAESASESKTRFFAAASHDLRQPLHALSINATTLDLLARRSGDALLIELSQGIGSALRQSRGLLDGLLDISRLDANAVQARLVPNDIGVLLNAVRDEFAALAAQRGLTLDVRMPAGVSAAPWVSTDADQLLRILGNLVDNAIKFSAEGGVLLAARALQVAGEDRVQVSVTDTGPGIAEAERERVFEEFYQAGKPSRDSAHGLGLGLAIVKRTAVLLNAPLQLVCEPGRGARFELLLPAAAAPVAACESVTLAPQAEEVGASERLSVLLIDDEPALLSSLCTYFRQIGWPARGVGSGDEAEAALAGGFHADVMAVDFRLRNENGADAIARLRSRHGALPAVIVTGDTTAPYLLQLTDASIGVLHKPVDGERLAQALLAAHRKGRA